MEVGSVVGAEFGCELLGFVEEGGAEGWAVERGGDFVAAALVFLGSEHISDIVRGEAEDGGVLDAVFLKVGFDGEAEFTDGFAGQG
ncbi:MAG: hypothetical protein RI897_2820 [Verrucomicrobiota bacterium]